MQATLSYVTQSFYVSCHQLGFVSTYSHCGPDGAGGRLWLVDVDCEGGEMILRTA